MNNRNLVEMLPCVQVYSCYPVFCLWPSTGHGECLLDKPSGRTYDLSPQLPGSVYDGNKQCELMFGPGSQVCPYLVGETQPFCLTNFVEVIARMYFKLCIYS